MANEKINRFLKDGKCKPCEGGAKAKIEITEILKSLPGWKCEDGKICKEFRFADYYETVSFVNAVAWIAHQEDHHPEIAFGYRACRITYRTHAIGGLSDNDFICAAKVNALIGAGANS